MNAQGRLFCCTILQSSRYTCCCRLAVWHQTGTSLPLSFPAPPGWSCLPLMYIFSSCLLPVKSFCTHRHTHTLICQYLSPPDTGLIEACSRGGWSPNPLWRYCMVVVGWWRLWRGLKQFTVPMGRVYVCGGGGGGTMPFGISQTQCYAIHVLMLHDLFASKYSLAPW